MGFFDKAKKIFNSKKENETKNNCKNGVNEYVEDKGHSIEKRENVDLNINKEEQTDFQPRIEKIRNFKYLDDLIHSGVVEISLDSDIVLSDNEISKYQSGIELNSDNLVIDGNGYAIDATGKARIFYCTGKNITLKNITLKNALSSNGGAIFSGSECVLTISNCLLLQNTAQEKGGAIYNYKGEVIISDSTLSQNTSHLLGGAIYNEQGEFLPLGDSFHKDGAIHNYSKLTITGSTLSKNSSQDSGAIFNWGGEVNITGSEISHNTASDDNGGIIFNVFGSMMISDCELSNNKSKSHLALNKDHIEINNSIFKDNEGANILHNSRGSMSILYSKFEDNSGESTVFNEGKLCVIKKGHFKNSNTLKNIANSSDMTLEGPKIDEVGESILNRGHIFIKGDCKNLSNRIYGGGSIECEPDSIPEEEKFDFGYLDTKIHENKTGTIVLDNDICFENYESEYYEGGIELDIDNLVIDGNGHSIDGAGKTRIFLLTADNITIKNLILKNGYSHKNYDNPSNSSGGAVKINHNIRACIKNCEFKNNASETNGGAINNNGNELDITMSTLSGNSSHINGGAIHNIKGMLNITDSTLTENKSMNNGGAIDGNETILTVADSKFSHNTAKSGGAIYTDGGEVSITNSTLSKNKADFYGGAINTNKTDVSITNSTLSNNIAKYHGGAIINDDGLNITHSTLSRNTANGSGGAIHNEGEMNITHSTLSENTAKWHGGAILNIRGALIITDSTLTKNSSEKGGAISNLDEKAFKQSDCEFKDNVPNNVQYTR